MGIDISWYRNLHEPLPYDRDTFEGEDDRVTFFDNDAFPGRIEGIDTNLSYKYDESDDFRAGSYSDYNRWRDTLAKLVGWDAGIDHTGQLSHCIDAWDGVEGPFSELINFSDCEGTIGPVVSAKLAKDFADYQEKADAEGGDFADRYAKWREAFEQAAQNGAVAFH